MPESHFAEVSFVEIDLVLSYAYGSAFTHGNRLHLMQNAAHHREFRIRLAGDQPRFLGDEQHRNGHENTGRRHGVLANEDANRYGLEDRQRDADPARRWCGDSFPLAVECDTLRAGECTLRTTYRQRRQLAKREVKK